LRESSLQLVSLGEYRGRDGWRAGRARDRCWHVRPRTL